MMYETLADFLILLCDATIFSQYVIRGHYYHTSTSSFGLGMFRGAILSGLAFFWRIVFDVLYLFNFLSPWLDSRIIGVAPWVSLLTIGVIIERRAVTGK